MKTLTAILLLLLFSNLAHCQSNKEIKLNKIKSVTSWSNDKEDGTSTTYKDSYEAFDKNGNTILKLKYKKDGTVSGKETWKYDKNENKVEEFEYDGNNSIVSHKTSVYNALEKKTEERELSASGELIRKTSFTYTPAGEKATETVTDAKGNVLKKVEYSYNARDLKTQRSSSNKYKKLETLKKWAYEYY